MSLQKRKESSRLFWLELDPGHDGPEEEEEALPHGDLPLAWLQELREFVLDLQRSFLEKK